MTSPLFQQFLSLWSCTKTCHSPWDHYQRSKGELLVRKNVEIRQQVGDATWISWEAETNLVILVTFPGFLLFFPTETSSETPNLGPENGLNKGCLRAGRSQGGLSLSQSLPALDMLDPNGWKCVWSSQFNPDQPLHHSLSLFQILKSWYNGHKKGPSTKIHQPTNRYFQFRSPPLRDLGRQRDLSSS